MRDVRPQNASPGRARAWALLWRDYRLPATPLLFFAAFFIYAWLRVDTRLVYFCPTQYFPEFTWDRRFLEEHLARPGGPVEWAGALLSQFYFYRWAGALILTGAAALLSLTLWGMMASAGGGWLALLAYGPALAVLLLAARHIHCLSLVLGLLAAAAAGCAYVRAPLRGTWRRLAAFVVLSVLLYYLAAGAALVFAALCGLAELVKPGRRLPGVLYLAWGGALPFLAGGLLLGVYAGDVYARLLPFQHDADPRALPLMLALYAVFVAGVVLSRLKSARLSGTDRPAPDGAEPAEEAARPRRAGLRRAAVSVGMLSVVVCVAVFAFDRDGEMLLRVEFCARQGRWEEALEAARQVPVARYDLLAGSDVNRALFHTGRLADEMFTFPQHSDALVTTALALMSTRSASPWAVLKLSDIMHDLGHVNDAEHLAQEAYEQLGRRPWILERLAVMRLAKRQTEGARVLFRALSRDAIFGGVGAAWLRRLDADPLLAGNEELRRLRASMLVEDEAGAPSVEEMLQELLARNGRNRMAFEYLMAYYLLNRRLEQFAANLRRLPEFGRTSLPRHYQEALLVYRESADRPIALLEGAVSEQTARCFDEFAALLADHADDPEAGRRAAWPDYGGTYFYYYLFGPGSEVR